MKRVLPFLLLNIAVSAVTMILVLVIWQAVHTPPENQAADTSALLRAPTRAAPTPISYADQSIEILNVIGAGDLQFEAITLKNTGTSPVNLSGWSLSDGQGKPFIFPTFTVFQGGAFQVFSRSGLNTSLELYWGSEAALWKNGAKVFLYDPTGEKQQEFSIP